MRDKIRELRAMLPIPMAEAKQLLRSKEYTILQISEMLNFTSQSLFGRYFKKFTGYTPKEYQSIK